MADTLEAGGVHARKRLPAPAVERDDAQFRAAETGRRQFLQLAAISSRDTTLFHQNQ